jgi:hypothetical protein
MVVVALLLCAGFVIVLAPPGLPPYWSVYQRFTVFMLLGVILTAALGYAKRPPGAAMKAVIVLVAAVHMGLWAEHFIAFRTEANTLRQVLPEPAPGAILGVHVTDATYRGDVEALHYAADYHTAWHGGIVVSNLYDFPFTVVRRRADETILPRRADVRAHGPDALVDYPHVRHVLVRGRLGDAPRFESHFHEARTAGRWRLYERRALRENPE